MSPEKLKALIVGDELALRRVLRRSLADNAFRVEEVRTDKLVNSGHCVRLIS
jgi:CheY-like chemotaxis protein